MLNKPRVIFMGSPAFAVPSLTVLAERPDLCEVVAVVTQPDRPAGRGRQLQPGPVKVAAQARGLPVLQPTKMRSAETRDALAAYQPQVMVVAAYGRILPPSLLELPSLGCINVHASLLPRHRGASPIAHAILAGDATTGVAIMQMEEGLDTGPVFAMREEPIAPTDTTGSLTVRLSQVGASLLADVLPDIFSGELQAQTQDHARATYAPLLSKEDGRLNFTRPAAELARRVRAFSPWPGTFAFRGEQRVQVMEARPASGAGEPGQVLAADREGVLVASGEEALLLTEVKPAGKKQMTAAAWVAGRGVAVGDRLS